MKTIEARKHTFADDTGNVTPRGKQLAEKMSPILLQSGFVACFSAPAKRNPQTMEAFGFREYEIEDGLANASSPKITQQKKQLRIRPNGSKEFSAYFEIPELQEILIKAGARVLGSIKKISRKISDNKKALIVAGGGALIPALKVLDKNFDIKAIGGRLKECEGVRFYVDDNRIIGYKILRDVP